jgi:8-oxo-dGTP diphosphatase
VTRFLLVRHASAGNRKKWTGDDRLRPLDKRGRRQAAALPGLLAEQALDRLISSPYVRCVETLEPLAERLDLPVEIRFELAEGSTDREIMSLLHGVKGETVALCTHGDVVEALLGEESPKGSVWVLELLGGLWRRELYIAPG